MSCKEGGFISIRQNDLRDLTAYLLPVYNDVDIEARLLPVTGKKFENQSAKKRNEAKVDIN